MTELLSEVEKLKFYINLIGSTLDSEKYPIASLVIQMNWSEKNLDEAHDIFEKYSNLMESNSEVNWGAFEADLKNKFNISYQGVKPIVLAFYRNHQWMDVCIAYAKAYECIEFHEITKTN